MTPDKQAARERARLQACIGDCRDRPEKTARKFVELEDDCEWWRMRSNQLGQDLAKLKNALKELSKGTT